MKITAAMLPPEVVREVKDEVKAQVVLDTQALCSLTENDQDPAGADRIATILEYGVKDRALINQAISEGDILHGKCYRKCYHCCSMSIQYEVEAFDILLCFWINRAAVQSAYQAGRMDAGRNWCGMLKKGLCTINLYKPYTCLLTSPSPRGAEQGGCYFRGDTNAKITVHKQTMIVTRRMRMLFKKWLPELPEFVGQNMNQAFAWAVKTRAVNFADAQTVTGLSEQALAG
jgi:hypothetical protein